MEWILSLALKSVIVAGMALLLLRLARDRSAIDRSWIAHLGLAAVLLLPLAVIALPALEVAGPSFLADTGTTPLSAATAQVSAASVSAIGEKVAPSGAPFPVVAESGPLAIAGLAGWAYAIPAALLILLTLIALGRLIVLKARATVLVEQHWLSALAHAQRRMGFKNGTALLTSDDLPSPVSWGLFRPVILLNSEATESHAEAEAIIAHELAHVANFDWAKLLLARIAVALFWFNPLVWLLAREAHQLREEAADDAVLAADIDDTDYARLLVGVARHDCRGLLIGAHGVAPARNSLARRIRRVLDGALERAPGGWRWTSAVGFFAAGMAVPVAALQVVAPSVATAAEADAPGIRAAAPAALEAAAPAMAATAVTAAQQRASSDIGQGMDRNNDQDIDVDVDVDRDVDIGPPNVTPVRHHGRVAVNGRRGWAALDRAIEMKAIGASPAYVAAIRAAAPNIRLDHESIIELKAVGITPAYIADLARSGYPNMTADDIVQARTMGISGAYIRGMSAAGFGRLPMKRLVEMRAIGLTAAEVARFRRAGRGLPSVDQMVAAKTLGVDPEDIDPHDSR